MQFDLDGKKNAKMLAVIISFNPEKSILALVNSLQQSKLDVLIIDNTTTGNVYINLLRNRNTCIVETDKTNKGIGRALNMAITYCERHDIDFLFTFDQDSLPNKGYINKMVKTAVNYKQDKNRYPILIGPTFIGPSGERFRNDIIETEDTYNIVETVMTSGNMININYFIKNKIKFNENYFIDHVDHEICFRLQDLGYEIVESKLAILSHELGYPTTVNFLGKKLTVYNHSTFRLYFLYRNFIWLKKTYSRKHKRWFSNVRVSLAKRFLKILFFEKNKNKKMISIFKGLKDGYINAG
ncbi:glycosyltransferase [Enterococcus faecium]|uniref:glycosyltransferase n=1 Tax=Enterococcus faecium TaxID=1352 RepID=UPI0019F5EF00|nr:glycosyltransferase [Enterococcus faecium]EGP5583618.1 glycosyltransferase [Enterococcus faecium]MCD4959579.1 glycosyltransferase [Enterococcus faecium]MCV3177102.1 glycosyltransferase [Enterococcus faecium]MCV3182153.1 glycosyltransferase [Enterococcus faecium]MCV3184867.1 glycosyltransferase [Enterococcus faecium]